MRLSGVGARPALEDRVEQARDLVEFAVRERTGELVLDGPNVHRRRCRELDSTFSRQHSVRGPTVVLMTLSSEQPTADHLVDDPTHPGAAEHHAIAEIAHAQAPTRSGG